MARQLPKVIPEEITEIILGPDILDTIPLINISLSPMLEA
jgi:hypothetical protein